MNKLYSESAVQAIADNLRKNLGNTETYKISEMATGVQTAIDKYKNNNPTATSTDGNLTNAYDVPMVDYEIDGKSEQDKISQLFDNTQVSWGGGNPKNGISFTKNNDGSVTLNGTCTENFWLSNSQWHPRINTIINNKYLCKITGNLGDLTLNKAIGFGNSGASPTTNGCSIVVANRNPEYFQIQFKTGDTFNNNKIYYQVFDLTAMYGAGNEPTIEQFNLQYPNEYYPFTNGLSPSPGYPQEIKSVGDLVTSGEHAGKYEIPVRVSGKNSFDDDNWYNDLQETFNITKVTIDNIEYYQLKRKSATSYLYNITLKENTQYKFMAKYSNVESDNYLSFVYSDGSSSKIINAKAYPTETLINVTSAINKTVIGIKFELYGWSNEMYFREIMLQESSISDEFYEPYHTPITTPIYLDRPLYNLPNGVKDKIRFSTGKRTNAVGEVVLDGSEVWASVGDSTANPDYYYCYSTLLDSLANGSQTEIRELCNRFHIIPNMTTAIQVNMSSLAVTSDGYAKLRIMILKEFVDSSSGSTIKDKFRNWLSTHNTQVLYQLATPTEESIDLPQLNLWEGTNIIEIGTEVQPSEVEYVYITKVGE